MLLLRLYFEFFKVGLFSVGGGLATIPFLNDLGTRTGWFTTGDVANMLAISESTPGPIGVNMATNTGFSVIADAWGIPFGVLGGIVATLGLITPAIVIILIVSKILDAFKDSKTVGSAMYGLRAASIGLVMAAAYEVVKITLIRLNAKSVAGFFQWKELILMTVLFAIQKIFPKLHPIFLILLAGAVGVIFKLA